MWETILATVLVSVASAVIGIVGKAVSDWSAREKKKAEADKELEAWAGVVEAVEVGVAKAEAEYVKLAKEAAADGKLSKAEKEEAKDIARRTAMEVAGKISGSAADLLARMAVSTVTGIIEMVLGRKKKGK